MKLGKQNLKFREDINALRALSVIGVIVFHFEPHWLPGGFIGVDVFFVISGFLMTNIILSGLTDNTFSLIRFYIARANRIIPALAVVCVFILLLGVFVLTPFDNEILSQHVSSSILFLSNINYANEAGYFDSASKEKWLLHTWSLSVEWQFYIVFPVIILTVKRLACDAKFAVKIMFATSLVYCIYLSNKDPNSAYFSLFSRAWEMLLGSLAYFYTLEKSNKKTILLHRLGLVIIVLSMVFVDENLTWPSFVTLIPTLGAFIIIISNENSGLMINNKFTQRIGLYSYSLYLWHWPIAVYGYYFRIDFWWMAGGILTVVMGALSYKYVENNRILKVDANVIVSKN